MTDISKLNQTAADLRELVREAIASSIELHRASRSISEDDYITPDGAPTDKEVEDFITTNPLLDAETVAHILDPGLLGFEFSIARLSQHALNEFKAQCAEWANTNEWLAADLVPYHAIEKPRAPQTSLWLPGQPIEPDWFAHSPNALLLAADKLRSGGLLSELDWRTFERLIAALLQSEGYEVQLMRGTKDGGVDAVASFTHHLLGPIKTIWQGKKYGNTKKVQLSQVRELSGIVDRERVTKGVIVTTSSLTRGAVQWIQRDHYRLDYMDNLGVEAWIRRHA